MFRITRLLAAIGAVAVLALAATTASYGKADDPVTYPAVKRSVALHLVSLGPSACGELFVLIKNGRPGLPMC
jgi:hypothetical protein